MDDPLNIPDDMRPAFEQVMKLAPEGFRDSRQFQQSILMYLKLGGVKLARLRVDIATKSFCEEFNLAKKRVSDLNETEDETENDDDDDEKDHDNIRVDEDDR